MCILVLWWATWCASSRKTTSSLICKLFTFHFLCIIISISIVYLCIMIKMNVTIHIVNHNISFRMWLAIRSAIAFTHHIVFILIIIITIIINGQRCCLRQSTIDVRLWSRSTTLYVHNKATRVWPLISRCAQLSLTFTGITIIIFTTITLIITANIYCDTLSIPFSLLFTAKAKTVFIAIRVILSLLNMLILLLL